MYEVGDDAFEWVGDVTCGCGEVVETGEKSVQDMPNMITRAFDMHLTYRLASRASRTSLCYIMSSHVHALH